MTDKPAVGKEIAKVVGAIKCESGYMTGNGYTVAWTLSNMLSLAMPKKYGHRRLEQVSRYPYRYLGCTLPVSRLWISSLTDEAIRKGMADLPVRWTKSGQRSIPPL